MARASDSLGIPNRFSAANAGPESTGGVSSVLRDSQPGKSRRPWILVPIVVLILVHQFPSPGTGENASVLYSSFGIGLGIDMYIIDALILAYVAAVLLFVPRRKSALMGGPELVAATLCGGAILVALLNGATSGSPNLFYDLQGLLVGAAVAFLTCRVVQSDTDAVDSIKLLIVIATTYSLILFVGFIFFSSGATAAGTGGRTPLYDGSILWLLCGASLFAFNSLIAQRKILEHRLALLGAFSCGFIVLISLRRTFWSVLVIGILVSFVLAEGTRPRVRIIACSTLALLSLLLLSGGSIAGRLESFNPGSSETQFSITNQSHFDDVHEAWAQVQHNPFLGRGLGVAYDTTLTRSWKGGKSWGVHNALLHVWVFYGLLGLVAFLVWHGVYFRRLYRLSGTQLTDAPYGGAVRRWFGRSFLGWSVGTFIVGALFTPWPYTGQQTMLFVGMMWGITFALFRSTHPATSLTETNQAPAIRYREAQRQ
jgi:O-antigen ligase